VAFHVIRYCSTIRKEISPISKAIKKNCNRKTGRKRKSSVWNWFPGRNDFAILKDLVQFFRSKNFVISFGTEHNTPQLDPVKVSCRNGVEMDEELNRIGYEGACIIAAHQYLIAKGEEGFLSPTVLAKPANTIRLLN